MKCTKQGFEIKGPQIAALLAFAGEGRDFGVIYLRVPAAGGKLHAAASNGKGRVWCENTSNAPKSLVGEYRIAREFLEDCCKLCETDVTHAVLKLNGKGVERAVIVDSDSGKPSGPELVWKEPAASGQLTLAKLDDAIPYTPEAAGGTWFAVNPKKLAAAMNALSRATGGCPVTVYGPRSPEEPYQLEARAEHGHWGAVLAAESVLGPGGQKIDRDDEQADADARAPRPGSSTTPPAPEKPARGRKKRQAELPLEQPPAAAPATSSEPDDDGIVDDDYPNRVAPPALATSRKRKAKAKAQKPVKAVKKGGKRRG
jgi:hypothetical protein